MKTMNLKLNRKNIASLSTDVNHFWKELNFTKEEEKNIEDIRKYYEMVISIKEARKKNWR